MKKTQSVISFFLCLILLFFVVSSPLCVKVQAAGFWSFALRSIAASLLFSGASEVAEQGPSAFNELVDLLGDAISPGYNAYIDSQEEASALTGIPTYQLSTTFIDELYMLLKSATINTFLMARGFNSEAIVDNVGVMSEQIKQEEAITQKPVDIYLPSEEALARPGLITQQQLLTGEFAEALAWNNVLLHDIKYEIANLNGNIRALRRELIEWVGNVNDTVAEFGRDTEIWLGNVNSSVSTWGRSTVDWLKNVNANLVHYSGVLGQKIDNVALKFDALLEVFPQIGQQLDVIVEKIPAYVEDTVVVQKPAVEVQVKDEVLVVSDYATLGNAFELKLSWIPEIFNFLKELFDRITYTGVPPKVILNLSSSDPSSPWNQDVCVLDMSWYEPYKSYGDTIFSGFLWLGFGWLLYKRTPGIINGVSIIDATPSSGPSLKGVKGGKKGD